VNGTVPAPTLISPLPSACNSDFTATFTYNMLKLTTELSLQLHRFCHQSHCMASEIITPKKKTSLPCRQVIHERVHFPLTEEIQIHHAEVRSERPISQITRNMPDTKLQYGCFPSVHPHLGFNHKNC